MQISPQNVTRLSVADGGPARVVSHVGSVVALVEVTANLMPGVVSFNLPKNDSPELMYDLILFPGPPTFARVELGLKLNALAKF